MNNKLVLIDGHSILNRAFYGLPDLTNAEGLHTNAVYGFLNIIFRILDEEKPTHFAVAFDLSAPTFRHKIYDAYKGTRKPMPEELREQVPLMKEVLRAMGVLVMEQEGYEADDILGTMAKRAEKEGFDVSLVSGDRDLLQIASDHIKIRIPKTKAGKTQIEDYYAKDVLETYQVTPLQFIQLKALMGDTADNIPGVPKVGEKTATDLMVSYGSIDEIYQHIEEIGKKSIKETLLANRHLADLSLELATICIDAPISFSLDQAVLGSLFTKEAYDLYVRLNFKNLLDRFDDQQKEDEILSYEMVSELSDVNALFEKMAQSDDVTMMLYQTKEQLHAVSFCYEASKAYCICPFLFVTEAYLIDKIIGLTNALHRAGKELTVFDVKQYFGVTALDDTDAYFDLKLAAYLINPNHKEYEVEDFVLEYANYSLKDYKQTFGKKTLDSVAIASNQEFAEYAGAQALWLYRTKDTLQTLLKEQEMDSLYRKIDMPLTYVLYDMEKAGIQAKKEALLEYSQELGRKIDAIEASIYQQVGEEFNINSPKQLGEILFEKMGLKGGKKTKTGYSTAADVLEKLAATNPVVNDILEYRALTKLKSTYADGLVSFIDDTGRIHTTYHQMLTATGRLSSSEPNLQNIPMRTEMGRLIRKVFVAKEGCVLVDADYSQIELRILAHLSKDEELIDSYHSGADIHKMTASKVFGIPFDEVSSIQRRNAKAVNFGIVYGISAFGLSQDIHTSTKEAQSYMDQYFATYRNVKAFQEQTVAKAKEDGYTVTMFKRRRPMPELASSNFMQRQFGERAAMNAPIQGTAADIIKIAMLDVYRGLKDANLKSKMILQIHDELIIEAYEDELEQVKEILKEKMEHAVSLAVPMEVDLNVGDNWYDAH